MFISVVRVSSAVSLVQWLVLIGAAFFPPLVYVVWIRNTERCHREKWAAIAVCFLWGASIAIIAAIILEVVLDVSVTISAQEGSFLQVLATIMIAPFAEELIKPMALRTRSVRRELNEPEDGLIYGAVAGLGFSATENLFYGFSFLSYGFATFVIYMVIRSVGGCLLHASATALTGYGYGLTVLKKRSVLRVVPYFVMAMLAHGLYNFLVSWETIGVVTGLFLAFILVFFMIRYVRRKIQTLDGYC